MTSASDVAGFLEIVRGRGVLEPIRVAIVLGTGLVRTAEDVEDPVEIPYADLPGFPAVGVSGHAGSLLCGRIAGHRAALMQGRAHYYETGNLQGMRSAFECLKALGVDTLLLTNAAGSLRLDWHPGSVALITDHINFSGINPLLCEKGDGRFVNMVDAYDPRLRARIKLAAQAAGVQLHDGVYIWFPGPSFETPAEIRMAKLLGGDIVGMSTVPEVIIARYLGFDVAAVSVITNHGAGIAGSRPSHGETKNVALSGSIGLRRLIRAFMKSLDDLKE